MKSATGVPLRALFNDTDKINKLRNVTQVGLISRVSRVARTGGLFRRNLDIDPQSLRICGKNLKDTSICWRPLHTSRDPLKLCVLCLQFSNILQMSQSRDCWCKPGETRVSFVPYATFTRTGEISARPRLDNRNAACKRRYSLPRSNSHPQLSSHRSRIESPFFFCSANERLY